MLYSKKLVMCIAIVMALVGSSSQSYAFTGGGGGASPEYSIVYDQTDLAGQAGDPLTWMLTITNDPNSTGLDYMRVYNFRISVATAGYKPSDFTIHFTSPFVLGSTESTYRAFATFVFDAGTPQDTIVEGDFFVDMMFSDDPSFETAQYISEKQAFSAMLTPSGSTIPEPLSFVLLATAIIALRNKFRR